MSSDRYQTSTPLPTAEYEPGPEPGGRRGISTDPASQEDLERVREIILGPDASRQRLRGAEVDRLREILFGPQIEAYERQLADLRRDLERMTSDLNDAHDRIAEAEKSAARRMELLELNLRKLVEDQRREQERQRSRDAQVQQLVAQSRQHEETIVGVGEGLLDLRKVHSASELEIRAARTAVSDMQDQIEQRTQAMRRDLRHAEDTLRAEVRHMTDRLDHQKTDRKALASMLIEVATRLETGNSMTGLLEGLAGAKE